MAGQPLARRRGVFMRRRRSPSHAYICRRIYKLILELGSIAALEFGSGIRFSGRRASRKEPTIVHLPDPATHNGLQHACGFQAGVDYVVLTTGRSGHSSKKASQPSRSMHWKHGCAWRRPDGLPLRWSHHATGADCRRKATGAQLDLHRASWPASRYTQSLRRDSESFARTARTRSTPRFAPASRVRSTSPTSPTCRVKYWPTKGTGRRICR